MLNEIIRLLDIPHTLKIYRKIGVNRGEGPPQWPFLAYSIALLHAAAKSYLRNLHHRFSIHYVKRNVEWVATLGCSQPIIGMPLQIVCYNTICGNFGLLIDNIYRITSRWQCTCTP